MSWRLLSGLHSCVVYGSVYLPTFMLVSLGPRHASAVQSRGPSFRSNGVQSYQDGEYVKQGRTNPVPGIDAVNLTLNSPVSLHAAIELGSVHTKGAMPDLFLNRNSQWTPLTVRGPVGVPVLLTSKMLGAGRILMDDLSANGNRALKRYFHLIK